MSDFQSLYVGCGSETQLQVGGKLRVKITKLCFLSKSMTFFNNKKIIYRIKDVFIMNIMCVYIFRFM